MKNWEKANCPGFDTGSGINECFIHEIEEITRMGFILVFQETDNKVQLVRLPEEQKHAAGLVGLPGYEHHNEETYNCFWNEGDPFDKKMDEILFYEWDLHKEKGEDLILIWWDHDLGDVVIDSMGPDDIGGADKVTDKVYFEWIT